MHFSQITGAIRKCVFPHSTERFLQCAIKEGREGAVRALSLLKLGTCSFGCKLNSKHVVS